MMMLALDNGAEDFEASDECYEITTSPEDFGKVREALEAQGIEFLEAEVQMVPSTYISLDEKDGEKIPTGLYIRRKADGTVEKFISR